MSNPKSPTPTSPRLRLARTLDIDGPILEHSQYFQGAYTDGTEYDDCAVGVGNTPAEALDDALDSLAQSGWYVPETTEALARREWPTDHDTDMVGQALAEALADAMAEHHPPAFRVDRFAHNGLAHCHVETEDATEARATLAGLLRRARKNGQEILRACAMEDDDTLRCYETSFPDSGVGDDEGLLLLKSNATEREDAREALEETIAEQSELSVFVVVRVAEHSDDSRHSGDGSLAPTLGEVLRDGALFYFGDSVVYSLDLDRDTDATDAGPLFDWIGGASSSYGDLCNINGPLPPAQQSAEEGEETPELETDWHGRPLVFLPGVASGSDYSGGGALSKANRQSLIELAEEYSLPYLDLCGGYQSYGIAFPLGVRSFALIDALESLAEYPILDEDLMGELEREEETAAWDGWAGSDFAQALAERFPLYSFDDAGEALIDLFREISDSAGEYWQHSAEGAWIDVSRVAEGVTLEEIRTLPELSLSDDAIDAARLLARAEKIINPQKYSTFAAEDAALATIAPDLLARADALLEALAPAMIGRGGPLRDLRSFALEISGWPMNQRKGPDVQRVSDRAGEIMLRHLVAHGGPGDCDRARLSFGDDAVDAMIHTLAEESGETGEG